MSIYLKTDVLDYILNCESTTGTGVYNITINSIAVQALCKDGWMASISVFVINVYIFLKICVRN